MSYIGNTLQTAFPSYLNIDDISGSFDGVTTSFALTVGGSAPVPAPVSSNQCLISVGGVVQRPDDTGTEGFRLNSGNIVFSSAPGIGEDFFGVILAGADYVNVGVNFPSGTAAAPSITFDTDLDTGIYNPGANEIGFTTAGVNRVTINSSGNVSIVNDLTVDTNTLHVDSTNNRVGIGTTSPDELLHVELNSTDTASIKLENTDGFHVFKVNNGNLTIADATSDRVRIDSSGRLLVGTSSAVSGGEGQYGKLQVQGTSTSNTAGAYLSLVYGQAGSSITSGANVGKIVFTGTDDSEFASIQARCDGTAGSGDYPGRLVFSTTADSASSPTERMMIDRLGTVSIGDSIIADGTDGEGILFTNGGFIRLGNATGSGSTSMAQFKTGASSTEVLRFRCDGDIENLNNSYGAISDINIKENIVDANSQWDDIKNIRIRKYNLKGSLGYETHTQIGLIAQELELVCPGLVEESFDLAEDGSNLETSHKTVSYSVLYVKALKALQEAIGRIETLEAEVAALKAQ